MGGGSIQGVAWENPFKGSVSQSESLSPLTGVVTPGHPCEGLCVDARGVYGGVCRWVQGCVGVG